MSLLFWPCIGLLLGMAGGVTHLVVTRARAAAARRRGLGFVWLTLPLSLAPPLLVVLLALSLDRHAVWGALLGLILARALLVRRFARALS